MYICFIVFSFWVPRKLDKVLLHVIVFTINQAKASRLDTHWKLKYNIEQYKMTLCIIYEVRKGKKKTKAALKKKGWRTPFFRNSPVNNTISYTIEHKML